MIGPLKEENEESDPKKLANSLANVFIILFNFQYWECMSIIIISLNYKHYLYSYSHLNFLIIPFIQFILNLNKFFLIFLDSYY